ncbi:tetratricopeptide repeat protein [Candidatus Sumerlaeota bacterium]|nr:tetratricopeptide repeat protein [Candidatus Sumerlaeota bacterium]
MIRRLKCTLLTTLALAVMCAGAIQLHAAEQRNPVSTDRAVQGGVQKAGELYQQADFAAVIRHLDRYAAIAPDHRDIRVLMENAKQFQVIQSELKATLNWNRIDQEEALSERYRSGLAAINSGDLKTAQKSLEEIWLLAGDGYKDSWRQLQNVYRLQREQAALEARHGAPQAVKLAEPVQSRPPRLAAADEETETAAESAPEEQIESLLDRAQDLSALKNFDEARKAYEEALKLDPENRKAEKGLKKLADLEEDARKEEEKRNARALEEELDRQFQSAYQLYRDEKYKQAIGEFNAILEKDEGHRKARKYLARSEKSLKRQIEEADALQQQNEINDLLAAAEAAMEANDLDAAQQRYEAVLALVGDQRDAERGIRKIEDLREDQAKERQAQLNAEQEAAEEAAAAQAAEERAAREKAEAEAQAEAEKLAAEQAEAERVAQEQAAVEQAEADQLAQAQEQAAAEKAEMQRLALEQAAAEKAEMERIMAQEQAAQEQAAAEARALAEKMAMEQAAAEEQALQAAIEEQAGEAEVEAEEAPMDLDEVESIEQEEETPQVTIIEDVEEAAAEETVEEAIEEAVEEVVEEAAVEEVAQEEQAEAVEEVEVVQEAEEQAMDAAEQEPVTEEDTPPIAEKALERLAEAQEQFEKENYEKASKLAGEAYAIDSDLKAALELQERAENRIMDLDQAKQMERMSEDLREEKIAAAKKHLSNEDLLSAEVVISELEAMYDGQDREISKLRERLNEQKSEGTQERVDRNIEIAQEHMKAEEYQLAIEKLKLARQLDPENRKAERLLQRAESRMAEAQSMSADNERALIRSQSENLFQKAVQAYQSSPDNIETAVNLAREALTVDPGNQRAEIFLEEVDAEYQEYLAQRADLMAAEQAEQDAQEKLNVKRTIETQQPLDLSDFLNTLSLISGINFTIADGINPKVQAKFEDKPLKTILNHVLLPIGLKWERQPGEDIIIVSLDLHSRMFHIDPENMPKLKRMIDQKQLQNILWHDEQPTVASVEMLLDEENNTLFLYDSAANLEKAAAVLAEIASQVEPQLIIRDFKIADESKGPKIKVLLEAILRTQAEDLLIGREIFVEGDTIIIKDTPENIRKAEQLLQDREFLRDIEADRLDVAVFDLTPREALSADQTSRERFAAKVEEVVKTILYTGEGITRARAAGRKMWFDKQTLQMTITDTPVNIRKVADYIASLPEIERRRRSKVIFLKFADAASLASRLEVVLGITSEDDTGTASGDSVTKTLRVEDELRFRDINIRLTRVNENDANDENDDSAEFVVRTPTDSRDTTIEEFRSEFVDDYEIIAEEVDPSSSSSGEGRARVTINYRPLDTTAVQEEETQQDEEEPAVEEAPISIDVFDDLNALLIRYDDPSLFAEVLDWIDQFDRPVKQVNITTKVVEVDDNRAKQMSMEWSILNLGEAMPDVDSHYIDATFGSDLAEASQSVFEPSLETLTNSPYLKSTTILNFIFGGESPVEAQLRLYEAQGIVTVVNGPHVTVLNGESADFQISRLQSGVITTNDNEIRRGEDLVDMQVSPTITELGSITLDIDIQLDDPVRESATQVYYQTPSSLTSEIGGYATGVYDPIPPSGEDYVYETTSRLIDSKQLQTVARVNNGQTIVLGGWVQEYNRALESGVPVLKDIPYIGSFLFGRSMKSLERTTLLIFLTAKLVD